MDETFSIEDVYSAARTQCIPSSIRSAWITGETAIKQTLINDGRCWFPLDVLCRMTVQELTEYITARTNVPLRDIDTKNILTSSNIFAVGADPGNYINIAASILRIKRYNDVPSLIKLFSRVGGLESHARHFTDVINNFITNMTSTQLLELENVASRDIFIIAEQADPDIRQFLITRNIIETLMSDGTTDVVINLHNMFKKKLKKYVPYDVTTDQMLTLLDLGYDLSTSVNKITQIRQPFSTPLLRELIEGTGIIFKRSVLEELLSENIPDDGIYDLVCSRLDGDVTEMRSRSMRFAGTLQNATVIETIKNVPDMYNDLHDTASRIGGNWYAYIKSVVPQYVRRTPRELRLGNFRVSDMTVVDREYLRDLSAADVKYLGASTTYARSLPYITSYTVENYIALVDYYARYNLYVESGSKNAMVLVPIFNPNIRGSYTRYPINEETLLYMVDNMTDDQVARLLTVSINMKYFDAMTIILQLRPNVQPLYHLITHGAWHAARHIYVKMKNIREYYNHIIARLSDAALRTEGDANISRLSEGRTNDQVVASVIYYPKRAEDITRLLHKLSDRGTVIEERHRFYARQHRPDIADKILWDNILN